MDSTVGSAVTMAAPEVGIPLMATQVVSKHGKSVFGGMLIAAAVLFIIIAIIIIAAGKSSGAKTAGWLFFAMGFAAAIFGGYLIIKDKSKTE